MLNLTKTVSCSVIGTAQQIYTKLMHRFEKFRKDLLVKFYSMRDFIFLTHELKQGKTLVWGLLQCKTLEVSNYQKIAGLRFMTCQSLKNPLGQVNLCFYSKLLC